MDTQTQSKPAPSPTAQPQKYMGFSLAGESYAIEVLKVREIIGYMHITPVPGVPAYVKGVINLRGNLIPVIDLRSRLGLAPAEPSKFTCIIVVEVEGAQGSLKRGIVVDQVSEVVNISGTEIENPSLGTPSGEEFILGVARSRRSITMLLSIDALLRREGNRNVSPLEQAYR